MEAYAAAETRDVSLADRARDAQLPPPAERERIRRESRAALRDMASELGVSAMTVSRWERGESEPRFEHAARYGRLLAQLRAATDAARVTA